MFILPQRGKISQSKYTYNIILCTTDLEQDKILCDIAEQNDILFYQGDELNKSKRWYEACQEFDIDFFVTADGDDLFYDSKLADLVFKQYEKTNADFINGRGFYVDIYGIKNSALTSMRKSISKDIKETEPYDLELWFNTSQLGHQLYKIQKLKGVPSLYEKKQIRMTLDYEDDFKFFKNVIEHFDGKKFGLHDIIYYIDNNPSVKDINKYLEIERKANQKK